MFPNNIISILNDPFDGKASLIIKRICRFRNEVKRSPAKLTYYEKLCGKQIPAFCTTRWNEKYDILETFVDWGEVVLKMISDLDKDPDSISDISSKMLWLLQVWTKNVILLKVN